MTDREQGNDETLPGESIADVFPHDDITARFVVAMSIARNDIELALRDGIRAAERDAPDFTYRVRLGTSHLVEGLDSLNAYSKDSHAVRSLMAGVLAVGQNNLKIARGTLQKVGSKVLQHVRDNTFHVPSPQTRYDPTSDDQLRDVLAGMSDRRATVHLDGGPPQVVTLTFARDVALALALAKHSANDDDARRQFAITSEGAVAFAKWVDALLVAFFKSRGTTFGRPELLGPSMPEADGPP